ncbi:MAG: hypothetical protein ACO2O0_03720 [Desulfurococcales archaeon]|jgi:DNA-binding protein
MYGQAVMVQKVASIAPARDEDIVVIGRERSCRYVLDIITIVRRDKNTSKAVTIYNTLRDRLGDALEFKALT